MKGQVKAQLGFGDEVLGARAAGNGVLERMHALAPWAQIQALLDTAYPCNVGRPSHDPLVLFKMTLLQHLYNLSDPQCEAQVRDRLSFLRFVGLGLADEVPDETALVRFRARLSAAGVEQAVLDLLNARLAGAALIIKRGTLLDASFVPSAGRHDSDARSMGNGPHKGKHGYKLHVGVDQDSGLIRKLVATQANVHDGVVGHALISGDEAAVIADRAYDRRDLRARLKAQGAADGLMRKAHAGIGDGRKAQIAAANRLLAPVRAAVERTFADLKCRRSLARSRYVGLAKNLSHFLLLAFTHNLRRAAVLTR
jgi:IS5 family transposase